MKSKQMLEAVIEKAIKNGWEFSVPLTVSIFDDTNEMVRMIVSNYSTWQEVLRLKNGGGIFFVNGPHLEFSCNIHALLFNHDFAKACFGEEEICADCLQHFVFTKDEWVGKFQYDLYTCDCGKQTQPSTEEAWRLHLQEAVLSEDPLLYYYQHL